MSRQQWIITMSICIPFLGAGVGSKLKLKWSWSWSSTNFTVHNWLGLYYVDVYIYMHILSYASICLLYIYMYHDFIRNLIKSHITSEHVITSYHHSISCHVITLYFFCLYSLVFVDVVLSPVAIVIFPYAGAPRMLTTTSA